MAQSDASSVALSRYKLLALDLDGTLVHREGRSERIDPRDLRAIARLQASGVTATIITGRLYGGARDAARQAEILGPIACADGCHIIDTTDERDLVYHHLAGERAETIRAILGDRPELSVFLFGHRWVVYDRRGEPYGDYVHVWSPEMERVVDVYQHTWWTSGDMLLTALAIGGEGAVAAAVETMRATLADSVDIFTFPINYIIEGVYALMVRAAGMDKGTALRRLAEHHGCRPEEVVAVGDWLNDRPMFRVAGRAFAMGQSPESVREVATDILTATRDTGGGIAETIAAVWGI